MHTQMVLRIDSDIKNRFDKLAKIEGKTTSQVARELVKNYIEERDISAYVDSLWNRIGHKLKSRGVTSKDINIAIKEVRAKTSESRH